jgi:alpha-glucosidase
MQKYWDDEFASFFNADTGVDIDALWIDMNEPSNLYVEHVNLRFCA